ncbi:hypothetical protein DENSPDRAFT_838340 [Dentipellis sp. KUC8613]|nr:hypothetical protein DENSPDRAFT_838340 [Dentipellis sp. KUC8613]
MYYTLFSIFQTLLRASLPQALTSPFESSCAVMGGKASPPAAVFSLIVNVTLMSAIITAVMLDGSTFQASAQHGGNPCKAARNETLQATPPEAAKSVRHTVLSHKKWPVSAAVPRKVVLRSPYPAAQHMRAGAPTEAKA